MTNKTFNLITQPWIQVIDRHGYQQTVSLKDLFEHAQEYRQLAGDMRSQDLTILRFLIAILTTVYSRFDAKGQSYPWIKIDLKTMQLAGKPNKKLVLSMYKRNKVTLLHTWSSLYQQGHFSSIVVDYLKHYRNRFDLLDDRYPFYQFSKGNYDALKLILRGKKVGHDKGKLAIKQINRTISESNNSRFVFSPRTELNKNKLDLASLTRWLIMYQNFTGVTDKIKLKKASTLPVSGGWLYSVRPVFIEGRNLFETLMLNLDLNVSNTLSLIQRPVWEWAPQEYVDQRAARIMPDNLAELYTLWSRILHIEWDGDQPTIFTAGLPKADSEGSFIEPMTTWKYDKKDKVWKPATFWIGSLSRTMWRNFGEYVSTHKDDEHEPGIVNWLQLLKNQGLIANDFPIRLTTVGLIKDGNANSQMPAVEVYDQMELNVDVLFDKDPEARSFWPMRIEGIIKESNRVGNYYQQLVKSAGELRGLDNPNDYAKKLADQFYESLNEPFYRWLASLTSQDDRDQKCDEWRNTLRRLAHEAGRRLLDQASPQEFRGKAFDNKLETIFSYYNRYTVQLSSVLGKKNESGVANEQ